VSTSSAHVGVIQSSWEAESAARQLLTLAQSLDLDLTRSHLFSLFAFCFQRRGRFEISTFTT
jgi:hypothetical protein